MVSVQERILIKSGHDDAHTVNFSYPTLIYVIDGSSSSTTCWRQARATWMSMWSGFPFRQPSHKPKQASFSNCLDLTSCFWNDLENEQRTVLPHVLIRKTKTQNLCQKPWRSKHRYQSSFIFFFFLSTSFSRKKARSSWPQVEYMIKAS